MVLPMSSREDRTNVVKLFYALEQRGDIQAAYYYRGLGTMEPPGALKVWERYGTRLLGLAFGYGLSADIRDAYIFLMNAYQEEGDRIFLFGFSRGAYVVRAVASPVHGYGLTPAGNEALVPYAVRNLVAVTRNEGAVLEALKTRGGIQGDIWRCPPLHYSFRGGLGYRELGGMD
jgi:uncharacterized protein (DUF2235 family)